MTSGTGDKSTDVIDWLIYINYYDSSFSSLLCFVILQSVMATSLISSSSHPAWLSSSRTIPSYSLPFTLVLTLAQNLLQLVLSEVILERLTKLNHASFWTFSVHLCFRLCPMVLISWFWYLRFSPSIVRYLYISSHNAWLQHHFTFLFVTQSLAVLPSTYSQPSPWNTPQTLDPHVLAMSSPVRCFTLYIRCPSLARNVNFVFSLSLLSCQLLFALLLSPMFIPVSYPSHLSSIHCWHCPPPRFSGLSIADQRPDAESLGCLFHSCSNCVYLGVCIFVCVHCTKRAHYWSAGGSH